MLFWDFVGDTNTKGDERATMGAGWSKRLAAELHGDEGDLTLSLALAGTFAMGRLEPLLL